MKIKIIMILLLLFTVSCTTPKPDSSINDDLNTIKNSIASINLSCPDCNCPKYEVKTCEVLFCDKEIEQTNNILLLDKFIFRMKIVGDNYKDLDENIEDKEYCKEEVPKIKEDIDLALSYTREFISKGKFNKDDSNTYSNNILEESQRKFKIYLDDIKRYCEEEENSIDRDNYKLYALYMEYYNNATTNSDFKTMEVLDRVRE